MRKTWLLDFLPGTSSRPAHGQVSSLLCLVGTLGARRDVRAAIVCPLSTGQGRWHSADVRLWLRERSSWVSAGSFSPPCPAFLVSKRESGKGEDIPLTFIVFRHSGWLSVLQFSKLSCSRLACGGLPNRLSSVPHDGTS